MNEENPIGTTPQTLADRIKLTWQNHVEIVKVERLPSVDVSLSFWENMYYIQLKGVLKIIAAVLTGTLAGNAATVVSNIIPDIQQTERNFIMSGVTDSPKTTIAGITALLLVIITVINQLVDGDPATNPDWAVVIPAVIGNIGMILGKFGKSSASTA